MLFYLPITAPTVPAAGAVASILKYLQERQPPRMLLFAHGWTVTTEQFTVDVDRLCEGLDPFVDLEALTIVALHWHASLSDDAGSIARVFDLASFPQMRGRADAVGAGAAADFLREVNRVSPQSSLTFGGHSFGARVVCSALNRLGGNLDAPWPKLNAVLLQGALDNDALESGKSYGNVGAIASSITVTTSKTDKALNDDYPLADGFKPAIGGRFGPTAPTWARLGGKLNVVDITDMQAADPEPESEFGGSHSKIFGPGVCRVFSQSLA